MPEITVYSRPGCQPCKATVKKLELLGAPYTKVDVTQDDRAREQMLELGYKTAPVVVVGDVHWGGFSPDKLEWAARHVADA
ncbi:glutaredoxin family protein [Nocardia otitidiscaviarum]|uniref:glutaredoxin family protein n=1 Tax=Nocardia otitidiscaviarum TaxID=1823 RepID=UPI00245837D5|nr:glutaredoxin family protein [Nocardia otitidiscaviarum]